MIVGAERRLGEGDRDGQGEIAALAPEERVGRDVHDDVEVAGRAAVAARLAAALHPDPLAVVDAGRDADLHLAVSALRSRCRSRSGTGSTILVPRPPHSGHGDESENSPWLSLSTPVPSQRGQTTGDRARARARCRRRCGSVHVAGDVDRRDDALDRLVERQVQLGLEVGAALRARLPASAAASAAAAVAGRRCRRRGRRGRRRGS